MPRARGRGRNSRGRGAVTNRSTNLATVIQEDTSSVDESIPEERYFLNPNAVSPHLMCSICQEVFNEPWRAPCGHSYCKSCIFMWLKANQSCPEDRRPLKTNDLHKDFIVENIISDYKVACPWRSLGCLHVGPLHSLSNHKNSCQFNPKVMPKILRDYSKEILEKTSSELLTRSIQDNLNQLKPSGSSSSINDSAASHNFDSINSITGSALLDRLLAESDEANLDEAPPEVTSTPPVLSNVSAAPPAWSGTSSGVENGTTLSNTLDPIVDRGDDSDEENIPEASLPPLTMRLYVSGNEESRNLLCNFLEGPRFDDPSTSTCPPPNKRQKKLSSF